MSATRHSRDGNPFDAVVVIGSQGALRSFQVVLDRLPSSFPAALVFDLHRGEGKGMIEQVLTRRCAMAVRPAVAGAALEASTLYLAPHDAQVTLSHDRLMRISPPTGERRGHPFADALLSSAAGAFGPGLIAVVLSGRLDRGACGVREVKRNGGRVIVEDPRTAAAPSMPNAALATGCVDFALAPEKIGDALMAMCAATGAAELFRVRLNAAVAG